MDIPIINKTKKDIRYHRFLGVIAILTFLFAILNFITIIGIISGIFFWKVGKLLMERATPDLTTSCPHCTANNVVRVMGDVTVRRCDICNNVYNLRIE